MSILEIDDLKNKLQDKSLNENGFFELTKGNPLGLPVKKVPENQRC